MTIRSLLALAVVSGVAMSAQAQTAAAPDASKDKSAAQAAFTKADANADGKLSKDEAKLPAGVKFEDLDKDKDGSLSADEFAAAPMK
jgi:hypothetical protein